MSHVATTASLAPVCHPSEHPLGACYAGLRGGEAPQSQANLLFITHLFPKTERSTACHFLHVAGAGHAPKEGRQSYTPLRGAQWTPQRRGSGLWHCEPRLRPSTRLSTGATKRMSYFKRHGQGHEGGETHVLGAPVRVHRWEMEMAFIGYTSTLPRLAGSPRGLLLSFSSS